MKKVKIIQITGGSFIYDGGECISIYGLGADGKVYIWSESQGTWILFKD